MTNHDEIKALLEEIRDRLPEPEGVEDEPDPCSSAHPEQPVFVCVRPSGHTGQHGYAGVFWPQSDSGAEPTPDDLPGEPVEPSDLRAGDRVGFTWEVTGERASCTLAGSPSGETLRSDVPDADGHRPNVVLRGDWAGGISDVRLIERAPREDEDPDEALGALIWDRIWGASWRFASEDNRAAYRNLARAVREHIEAEADDADFSAASLHYARATKAEAERDALRERMDALRADVESLREAWKIPDVLDHAVPHLALDQALARDTERAAKGEQR